MLAAGRDEFCENLRAACTVIACRTIGEEVVYNKFLAKQCVGKDNESIKLFNGISFLSKICEDLHAIVQSLELTGLNRVAQVFQIMRETPTCDFGVVDIVSVCALTGRMGTSFVVLRTPECGILVDIQYRKLIHCIWVLWHINDIEVARVEHCVEHYAGLSIRAGIDEFLQKYSVTEDELSCYYSAYSYVRDITHSILGAF